MAKPTQELVNDTAATIWAAGQNVTYDAMRERLRCRKIDLVPFMQTILIDPRQKRKPTGNITRVLDDLRKAVAENQRAVWNEQLSELREEVEELCAIVASRDAALRSAEAHIAELNAKLAAAQAEIITTRAAAERQTAPLLKMLTAAIRNQTERPSAPKITPASKWTSI